MITGRVSANREAIIELEIVRSNRKNETVEVAIDTGFDGYLTLPRNVVKRLKLQPAGNRRAILGDGNTVVLDVYLAKVLWHRKERDILVLQAEGGPLVGMSLLDGNRVTLVIVTGGAVTIAPLA